MTHARPIITGEERPGENLDLSPDSTVGHLAKAPGIPQGVASYLVDRALRRPTPWTTGILRLPGVHRGCHKASMGTDCCLVTLYGIYNNPKDAARDHHSGGQLRPVPVATDSQTDTPHTFPDHGHVEKGHGRRDESAKPCHVHQAFRTQRTGRRVQELGKLSAIERTSVFVYFTIRGDVWNLVQLPYPSKRTIICTARPIRIVRTQGNY